MERPAGPPPKRVPEHLRPIAGGQTDLILRALEKVLDSHAFRNSKQSQKFLRYVVENTLRADEELLRERIIGIEVFGRDPDYDTGTDPVVRVRATEVRKRLSQYYGELDGDDEVRFDMPSGSYRAEFHWPAQTPSAVKPKPGRVRWLVPAALCALLCLAAFVWYRSRPQPVPPSVIESFWAPVIEDTDPVLLYCGQPVVYFLSKEIREKHGVASRDQRNLGAAPVRLDPNASLRGKDVIPVTEQFVGIGNAHTSALLTAMFARQRKPVEIRYANDLSFSDLRSGPAVLIGAFSNLWTLEMTRDLRLVFEQEKADRRIRDRSNNQTWQLRDLAPDGKTPSDYVLVSRIFESATGQAVISAAGITQYGTRAAGEFITDAKLLHKAFAGAPPDWPRKNVQVLLETTIYSGTPAPPRVLVLHVW
ncbi:MAG: hypothetical protein KJZ79_01620 [Bryobacteraceae bacterium]|nr:hypothetical protein [Bryobacteraceae bacterium]